jgi:hypothetical protein
MKGSAEGERLLSVRHFTWPIMVVLLTGTMASAVALAPDERRRERIRGDDDPIIVPFWVAAPEGAEHVFYDPDATGSINTRPAKTPRPCQRLAFYPERPLGQQFREAC